MDTFTVTLFIFLGCVLTSRIVAERALRKLSPDEKVRLMDAFSAMRAYSFVPVILIVLVGIGLPTLFPDGPWWLSLSGLGACLVYIAALHYFEVRKIAALALPGSYTSTFFASRYNLSWDRGLFWRHDL